MVRTLCASVVALLMASLACWPDEPAGVIAGVVRDQAEGLIPGAIVRLTAEGQWKSEWVRTGDDGRFRFVDVPPGAYVVRTAAPGFSEATKHVRMDGNAPPAMSVVLGVGSIACEPPAWNLAWPSFDAQRDGRTLLVGFAAHGRPARNVRITIQSAGGGQTLFTAWTDRAGKFQAWDLQPGEYVLKAKKAGFHDRVTDVEIRPATRTRITVDVLAIVSPSPAKAGEVIAICE